MGLIGPIPTWPGPPKETGAGPPHPEGRPRDLLRRLSTRRIPDLATEEYYRLPAIVSEQCTKHRCTKA